MNPKCEIHNPQLECHQEGIRVLMAAEGSGGHLIPALEVARALIRREASVILLYSKRPQTAGLLQGLIQDACADGVQVHPVPFFLSPSRIRITRAVWRLWLAGSVWRLARRQVETFQPQVAVGFGGWFCVPVILAARQRHLPVLLHEQNVGLGRANRFLRTFADQMALTFEQTRAGLNGTPSVVTGLPIRQVIGRAHREEAARRFGFDPQALTVLILGGSQGACSINRLVCQMVDELSWQERGAWQFIHLTGERDYPVVQQVYTHFQLRCCVAPHLTDMALAYSLADVVVARAGASTIAELAQCGRPAVLIPYPYAGGHQRANARLVEHVGGGIQLEEATATPQRLLSLLRQLLLDQRLRRLMGAQMQCLAEPDATPRLARAILNLAKRVEPC